MDAKDILIKNLEQDLVVARSLLRVKEAELQVLEESVEKMFVLLCKSEDRIDNIRHIFNELKILDFGI